MRAVEKEKRKNELRWLEKKVWFVKKEQLKEVQKIMFKEKEK